MFWILRRTRLTCAAALLLNNSNNNDNRPASKNYNKLLTNDEEDYQNANSSRDAQVDNRNDFKKNELNGGTNEIIRGSITDIVLDDEDEFSDDSDYDEALTCNVCDRSFSTTKYLNSHKQKKRHFGCSACDSLFPSLMGLEHHKEEFEHWSDNENAICTDSESDDDESVISEECERLL